MNWLPYAILAPVLWGVVNVLDGAVRHHFIKDDYALTGVSALMKLVVAIIFFICFGIEIPNLKSVFYLLGSGLLFGVAVLFYVKAIHREEISRVILFLQVIPIITLFLSYFILGEVLAPHHWASFTLLFAGSIFAGLQRKQGRFHMSPALLLALLASFMYALSDVIFKVYEATFSSFFSAMGWVYLGMVLALPILFFVASPKVMYQHLKNTKLLGWTLLTSANLLSTFALLSIFYAFTIGNIALIQVISGIQPLVTFLIALVFAPLFYFVPKEDISKEALGFKGVALILILLGLAQL